MYVNALMIKNGPEFMSSLVYSLLNMMESNRLQEKA
jgi:hypothetical protein